MFDSAKIILSAALSILTACLVQTSAFAETKAGDTFGNWAIECHKAGEDKNACVLAQTVVDKDKKQKLLKIIVGKDKEEPFITTQVPLAIDIPAGVSVTVDQGKAIPLTVKTCLPAGCFATAKLNGKLLKSIKSGEKLNVSFNLMAGQKQITISGSTNGLAEGLKAAKLD